MRSAIHNTKEIDQIDLDELCRNLLTADENIRDIILFGSFAYAPTLAQDIDLLVTTTDRKDYGVYLDAVVDCPLNVDVVVRQPGDKIGDWIAWGVRTVGQLLVDGRETLEEVTEVPAPTFERARKIFRFADRSFSYAQEDQDLDVRDEGYKDAFNKLFDVARNAVMAYLDSEQTRWGQLRRALPESFEKRFKQIIDTCHVSYFYNGEYPQESVDAEFKRWRDQVEQFVDDLEQAASEN